MTTARVRALFYYGGLGFVVGTSASAFGINGAVMACTRSQ